MSNTTTNHDEIREWVESKGGKPAAVDRTHEGGDVGLIELMFPKNKQSEHGSLVEISWDEFFDQFEASKLALIYDEKSLFNKLIGRDTAEKREHGDHSSRHYADSKHKTDRAPAAANKAHVANQDAGAKAEKPAAGAKKSEAGTAETQKPAAKAKSNDGGAKHAAGEADDLKSREYTDAQGKVHHHTRGYAEKHASK